MAERFAALRVGDPLDPDTDIGPLATRQGREDVDEQVVQSVAKGARRLIGAEPIDGDGFFYRPGILEQIPESAPAYDDEIFGPVAMLFRAESLDEAIRIANGTRYALTAGVYSRSPARLDRARRELIAGNIYLNRGVTGALVGRQPFGGFRLSGIGSKAGGPDYLQQFLVPKTVTENTMRRGFAPPLE
jgi:RHH-type proline utilization regulon transcriptional repressor/proline dehydrogenase/delta 1-pyrroline-5-carboxylate dehydrogenase